VHAGDIAARPVQAGDQSLLDRIAPSREDDRYGRGCGPGHEHGNSVPDDHGHRPSDQIIHQSRQSVILTLAPAKFDRDVLALDQTCLLQALAERGYEFRRVSERRAAQEPYHRHRRLLRAPRAATRQRRRRVT
jgi:hypothetical protein